MSPVNEWVAALKSLRNEYNNNVLSSDYIKAQSNLAKQFIEKYPETLGRLDMVGRGTPRAILIKNNGTITTKELESMSKLPNKVN